MLQLLLELLGQVQLAMGDANQALSTFNKMAAVMPQSAQPLVLVADAPPHLDYLKRVFPYIFDEGPSESSRPRIVTHEFSEGHPIDLFGLPFLPLRLNHGRGISYGFRFGPAAYLTDHSDIPPESMERLQGLDILFLDALRHNPHPTHSTVTQSLRTVEILKPKRTFFTHISHDLGHARTEEQLPPEVRLAYDTMRITTTIQTMGDEG